MMPKIKAIIPFLFCTLLSHSQAFFSDSLNIGTALHVENGRDMDWKIVEMNLAAKQLFSLPKLPDQAFLIRDQIVSYHPNNTNQNGNQNTESAKFVRKFTTNQTDDITFEATVFKDNYITHFAIDGHEIFNDEVSNWHTSVKYHYTITLPKGIHTISFWLNNIPSSSANPSGFAVFGYLISKQKSLANLNEIEPKPHSTLNPSNLYTNQIKELNTEIETLKRENRLLSDRIRLIENALFSLSRFNKPALPQRRKKCGDE